MLASSKSTTVKSIKREVLMYLCRQQKLEAHSEVSIQYLYIGPTNAPHLNMPSNSLGLDIVHQSQPQSILSYVEDGARDSECNEN